MKLLIINGPNLNLLGTREPGTYGSESIEDVIQSLRRSFPDAELDHFQSNVEGELIDRLHRANTDGVDGVIFNPGGYTHTSVALRDAVASISVDVVEVHISNVTAREDFRHVSLIAPVCAGIIAGFGTIGYRLAVRYFLDRVER
ncbi:MAG: type II 3-dehydroquinate dehydratase [Bacteroidetes bacterium]|nr:type II 3-dehydroquinate dehydratase [Bacteroidota bacterium]